jgi:hypothetical protein
LPSHFFASILQVRQAASFYNFLTGTIFRSDFPLHLHA